MPEATIHHVALRDFCAAVLARHGVPVDEGRIVANLLVLSNLRGIDTHGVRRLASYVAFVRAGVVRPVGELRTLHEFPGGFCFDGGHGFGQVTAVRALELVMERAREIGIACATVCNGGHIGAHGNVALKAAEGGMIGLVMTNGRPALVPPGGRTSSISSTPFAIAAPSGRPFPLVLDMALGVVARGHILRALAEGEAIPLDWAVDRTGRPTADPRKASEGAIRPIGGHKGYGLALMFGMVSGVLSGAAFGADVAPSEPPDPAKPFNQGHFLLALDIEKFMPLAQFEKRAAAFAEEIKAAPKANGVSEIFVPGEQSYRTWNHRLKHGIPLSAKVISDLTSLGKASGLPLQLAAPPRNRHDDAGLRPAASRAASAPPSPGAAST
jgi:LDH2 family malate/lactate/ureidoglycolate dehydrogenase